MLLRMLLGCMWMSADVDFDVDVSVDDAKSVAEDIGGQVDIVESSEIC